jgi:hypothetical protein
MIINDNDYVMIKMMMMMTIRKRYQQKFTVSLTGKPGFFNSKLGICEFAWRLKIAGSEFSSTFEKVVFSTSRD